MQCLADVAQRIDGLRAAPEKLQQRRGQVVAFVDDDMGEGGGNAQLRLLGQLLEAVVAPDRHAEVGMGRPDDLLPEQPGVLGHHSLIDALLEASGAWEMLGADVIVVTVAVSL
ncbi:hypothetical protein D9M71_704480 [compost metagenome]